MNFLLHHAFALRELGADEDADYVAIGAMLPDFFRMARPRRQSRRFERGEQEDGRSNERISRSPDLPVQSLIRGCEHHASIDKWFHASEPFVIGERDLRRAFLLPESPKLVLFAHAAWEMCLDGAWLRQASAEDRDHLRRTEKAAPFVRAAADHEGVTAGLDDASLDTFEARMRRILIAFGDESIYLDYLDPLGIARRIAGIRVAFGLGVPSSDIALSWAHALEPFVTRADAALEALVDARAASLGVSLAVSKG